MAQDINRRSFISGAAAMGAIAATSIAKAGEADEMVWDEEQDVVILGSGCAGKSAAIECALDGVTPLVLEAMGIPGGDLMLNSGMMCGHGDRISKAHGIEISDEEVMAWVESQNATVDIYSGDMEPEVAYIVHTKGGETIDWLIDQGVVFEDRVEVEAHYCPLQMFHYTGGGFLIAAALDTRMEELGIETRLNSRGCKLFQDETGRVVGGVGIGELGGVPGVCELQKMYCLKEARGAGAAHRLMEAALAFARAHYEACYLETFGNMKAAHRFYEKHGFHRIDRPLGHTGHFGCDVLYLKELGMGNGEWGIERG